MDRSSDNTQAPSHLVHTREYGFQITSTEVGHQSAREHVTAEKMLPCGWNNVSSVADNDCGLCKLATN